MSELLRVNRISEPTRVPIGTVLLVPGSAEPERQPVPVAAPGVVQGS